MDTSITADPSPPRHAPHPGASFMAGVVEMLPLCLAVVPWGLLAGSMGVQSGLSPWQSVGMSALVFAGAAQLVAMGLLISGASIPTILVSVFLITAQHFIYGLSLRDFVSRQKLAHRLPIGFLLTDELFALSAAPHRRRTLSVRYLLGAGVIFYLSWIAFTAAGVAMATAIPDLSRYHLDFSIIATFATLVVPMVKDVSTLAGVATSLVLSMVFAYLRIEGDIVIAGCCGMAVSVLTARIRERRA